MKDEKTQLAELQARVVKLESDFNNFSQQFYKNNFSSSQVFNKDCVFTGRLQAPVHSSAPSVAEVGDISCISSQLFMCTTSGTVASPAIWTLVGSQS